MNGVHCKVALVKRACKERIIQYPIHSLAITFLHLFLVLRIFSASSSLEILRPCETLCELNKLNKLDEKLYEILSQTILRIVFWYPDGI